MDTVGEIINWFKLSGEKLDNTYLYPVFPQSIILLLRINPKEICNKSIIC